MCGDMREIPDRRHREHQQHHGPRPPTTPRPQALAPPRQRQDPDDQGRDERHLILHLRQRVPGDGGDQGRPGIPRDQNHTVVRISAARSPVSRRKQKRSVLGLILIHLSDILRDTPKSPPRYKYLALSDAGETESPRTRATRNPYSENAAREEQFPTGNVFMPRLQKTLRGASPPSLLLIPPHQTETLFSPSRALHTCGRSSRTAFHILLAGNLPLTVDQKAQGSTSTSPGSRNLYFPGAHQIYHMMCAHHAGGYRRCVRVCPSYGLRDKLCYDSENLSYV